MFRSTDGSEEWIRFDNGLPQSGHTSSIAIDTLNNRVYIGRSNGLYIYDNMTNVDSDNVERIADFILYQNYPNPFNPSTAIQFEIPERSFITIKVYDVLGNEITTLVKEEKPAGKYNFNFDGTSFSSGIYFYQLKTGSFVETKKMILLK